MLHQNDKQKDQNVPPNEHFHYIYSPVNMFSIGQGKCFILYLAVKSIHIKKQIKVISIISEIIFSLYQFLDYL